MNNYQPLLDACGLVLGSAFPDPEPFEVILDDKTYKPIAALWVNHDGDAVMGVLPAYRNQGNGTWLILKLIDYHEFLIGETGKSDVWVHCVNEWVVSKLEQYGYAVSKTGHDKWTCYPPGSDGWNRMNDIANTD